MTPFMSMKIHSGQIKKFRFKKITNQSRSGKFEPMKSVACPRKHDYWKSYFPNICTHMVNWTVLFKWNELTNQKLRASINQMSIIPNYFSILVYWSLVWPVLLLLLSLLSEQINKLEIIEDRSPNSEENMAAHFQCTFMWLVRKKATESWSGSVNFEWALFSVAGW